jgi:hypothetical protein
MIDVSAHPSIVLPVTAGLTKGPYKFAHGMHLMAGVGASGKTVTSLGIVIEQLEAECPARYEYVMEPRASLISELVTKEQSWQNHLEKALDKVAGGILVVDSLTYLVSRLNRSIEMEDELSRVTYAGGLSPRDIMGILFHDELARKHGVALIATLNAELFPVVDKLSGACEGQATLLGPGQFQHRDRSTRTWKPYTISKPAMSQAFAALKYDQKATASRVNRY